MLDKRSVSKLLLLPRAQMLPQLAREAFQLCWDRGHCERKHLNQNVLADNYSKFNVKCSIPCGLLKTESGSSYVLPRDRSLIPVF